MTTSEELEKKSCDTCGGVWVVAQQVRTPFGVMQSQWACPSCEGAWTEWYKDGVKVSGNGLVESKQEVEVNIPAGIKSWSKIRYPWMGNGGYFGGPEGDLYIKIVVKSSDKRRRDGDNLLVGADITLFDAVLWGEVEVPHPDGPVKVKIPKGLQVWEYIRVSNKWFGEKWLLKNKWDMIVSPDIRIPKRLSKKQEKLWKELQGLKA